MTWSHTCWPCLGSLLASPILVFVKCFEFFPWVKLALSASWIQFHWCLYTLHCRNRNNLTVFRSYRSFSPYAPTPYYQLYLQWDFPGRVVRSWRLLSEHCKHCPLIFHIVKGKAILRSHTSYLQKKGKPALFVFFEPQCILFLIF